ncbi:hypothetical protein GQX73_g10890 [Xylaria multiplex]|uniref:Uncharacterized protein n=1 Tax=Xylaria multiplex TaxID=323545 RepID=A0A7C8IG03_9PEZI|nr:hypothetical protein GQX73_g10890 [Xylaria multiplex]
MPPKTRGRPIVPEAPQPEPGSMISGDSASDHIDQGQDSDPSSDPDVSQSGVGAANFRFFNTTFSTFRLSPLYIGKNALTPAGLETLSRRLRDTLVGDVMRGVQVGLENDTTLNRLGALERVEWRECSPEIIFPPLADAEKRIGDEARQRHRNLRGRHGQERARGMQTKKKRHLLWLELEYEKTTFSALMLPPLDDKNGKQSAHGVGGDDESSQLQTLPGWTQGHAKLQKEDGDKTNAFAHFPLLLTRMPAPLKAVFVDFLSSTFDCRISPLHLGTQTLIHSLERWIEESGVGGGKLPNKDVALTLGFHLEPTTDAKTVDLAPDEKHGPQKPVLLGLKTVDVVVPAEESCRFLRAGKSATTNSNNTSSSNTRLGCRKRPAATTEREEERLRRRRLGGGKDQEGWTWRQSPRQDQTQDQDQDEDDELETFAQPFTNALSHYISDHLALDITHPGVRVLRVVCDAFALSETRMKIFVPRSKDDDTAGVAINTFLCNLVRRAQGREWSNSALRLANLQLIA